MLPINFRLLWTKNYQEPPALSNLDGDGLRFPVFRKPEKNGRLSLSLSVFPLDHPIYFSPTEKQTMSSNSTNVDLDLADPSDRFIQQQSTILKITKKEKKKRKR